MARLLEKNRDYVGSDGFGTSDGDLAGASLRSHGEHGNFKRRDFGAFRVVAHILIDGATQRITRAHATGTRVRLHIEPDHCVVEDRDHVHLFVSAEVTEKLRLATGDEALGVAVRQTQEMKEPEWLARFHPRSERRPLDEHELLASGRRIELPNQQHMVVRRVRRTRSTMVAAPAYLKKRGTPTQRADLAKHDLISLLSAPHAWHFEAEEEVLPVAPRVLAGSASFARELCLRGSGVAILPEFLVAADIAAGTLAELHAGARRASKQVFAVFPRESGTCRPCALFSISSTPHSTSVTRR